MKLSQKPKAHSHSCMVYGAAKTGKTLLAGKLAEKYNLIYIDMENGYESLLQLPTAWQERIELISLPDSSSYPVAIETCLKMVKGKVAICEEHGKVACMICQRAEAPIVELNLPALGPETVVVFDSMTQISASAIAHITKGQPDDYKLTFNDYGNLGRLLDIFLSHLQAASYNVVVISHEQAIEQEDKRISITPVGGTRNFSKNIAKFFGSVVYCTRKNRKHMFYSSTDFSSSILTGSRSNIAIEKMEDPSLLPIFNAEVAAAVAVTEPATSIHPANKPKATGGTTASNTLARLSALKK